MFKILTGLCHLQTGGALVNIVGDVYAAGVESHTWHTCCVLQIVFCLFYCASTSVMHK